jgi:hypothetical protein
MVLMKVCSNTFVRDSCAGDGVVIFIFSKKNA